MARSVALALEQLARLRDQVGLVVVGLAAERLHDLAVDPARADRRVGQVDDRVAAAVQRGDGGARGARLAGADLAADQPERALGDQERDPRARLLMGDRAIERAGAIRRSNGRWVKPKYDCSWSRLIISSSRAPGHRDAFVVVVIVVVVAIGTALVRQLASAVAAARGS